jgi:manganese/iron transport system permease protein
MDWLYWLPVAVAGTLAGASTGLLGVFIVGMRIPFLGVCVAHAALAGAVFGSLAGLEGQALLLPALAAAVATALALGLMDTDRLRTDSGVLLSLLFSLSMGLAFLGLGLFSVLGRSDNDVRSLLWGSLMFCRWRDVALMAVGAAGLGAFLLAFGKEMRAILFSRRHALAAGIPVLGLWAAFLMLTSVVLTVNFQTVGGLMIYSLLANPAAAAFQICRGYARTLATAAGLGAASGLGGFLAAAATNLPVGAMIVLVSAGLVGAAGLLGRRRRAKEAPSK